MLELDKRNLLPMTDMDASTFKKKEAYTNLTITKYYPINFSKKPACTDENICMKSLKIYCLVGVSKSKIFPTDYRTVLDFRTPAQTAELCMNLSLTYKGMPGEVAMVFLTITTDSTFVVIGNSSILLAIENDGERETQHQLFP